MQADEAQPGAIPPIGGIQPILDYVACFEEIAGSTEFNAQVYHSLSANWWRTAYALSDPNFDTEVFPSLETDVVAFVQPEGAKNAIRYALKKASRAYAAKLSAASGQRVAGGAQALRPPS